MTANGGTSHIVKKDFIPTQWVISTHQDANDPDAITMKGTHFERVLSEFIPIFVERIKERRLPEDRFEYIERDYETFLKIQSALRPERG